MRAARSLRRLPERLLHPLRRRSALRRLRSSPAPRVVLVVCHGNICRSPYAAALLREELSRSARTTVRVESAGFALSGRPCPPFALEVAASRGFDLAKHRSQQLTPDSISTADVIIVMDRAQREALRMFGRRNGRAALVLGDLDPNPIETRQIEDPVEQAKEVFERSYTRLERCVREFATAIGGSR